MIYFSKEDWPDKVLKKDVPNERRVKIISLYRDLSRTSMDDYAKYSEIEKELNKHSQFINQNIVAEACFELIEEKWKLGTLFSIYSPIQKKFYVEAGNYMSDDDLGTSKIFCRTSREIPYYEPEDKFFLVITISPKAFRNLNSCKETKEDKFDCEINGLKNEEDVFVFEFDKNKVLLK